jgi:hypothetical protein
MRASPLGREMPSVKGLTPVLCRLLAPTVAFAHGMDQAAGGWSLSGTTVIPLGLAMLLYAGGVARLWRQAGRGAASPGGSRVASCWVGLCLLRLLCRLCMTWASGSLRRTWSSMRC